MLNCDVCGKEFKNLAGLAGHKATVHQGKAYNPERTLKDKEDKAERVLKGKAERVLDLAIGDLCQDCQGKIKDKILPTETLVRLTGKPSPCPEDGPGKSFWDTEPQAEESSGGLTWFWLVLVALFLTSWTKSTKPKGIATGLFNKS